MANLKEIKRKIASVKGTQKTTRAMKLVSSAKLKRAEEIATRSKVYATKLTELLTEIAQKMKESNEEGIDNVFMKENKNPKKIDIVFVTSDKGLCGGFNHQTIKTVTEMLADFKSKDVKVRLRGIGRKGIDFFKFKEYKLKDEVIGLSAAPKYEEASKFILESYNDFMNGEIDRVILVHNGYVNKLVQKVHVDTLLPLQFENLEQKEEILDIEPKHDEELVLSQLVQKYVEFSQFFALLDSLAAEHSARMQAMDAATNNASDKVKELTLSYNKARQEAVTTELIEIISGMEALK